MWNFQRIICIWICCVSCMFGTTQLSSLVQAVPYEYFDDHEQSFYDLDNEQIQAKYDARLLTQQMLQTEQQQQQQQQQHVENLKGFHNSETGGGKAESRTSNDDDNDDFSTSTMKLQNNNNHRTTLDNANEDDGDDDGDDDRRNDWLEETSTKAAALTSAITETLDEQYLPRAASCFTNGRKFTHGQKVPRLDSCEVCLCMDGEIFCWWEKCDKKPTKSLKTFDDYSTPLEESSTTSIQLNPRTTYKTTLKPIEKPKTNKDYNYDDGDSAEMLAIQQGYMGLKEQQFRHKGHESAQHTAHHIKQMSKKQQQKEEVHANKMKDVIKKTKKSQKEQQKQHKTNGQFEQQTHRGHNHNNNKNNNLNYGSVSNGSRSKILNFPENLPSVLYYDYKTEEHHQHQHQHREQYLKHQRQKQQQHQLLLQQHEKELKHHQQQQQQQQQQRQHHVNHHHEYGQDFNTHDDDDDQVDDKTLSSAPRKQGGVDGVGVVEVNVQIPGNKAEAEKKLRNATDGSSTIFKYFNNGNENIYGADLQTDSDILPEPPTKKPTFLTSIADTTAATATATAQATEIPISQIYHWSTATAAGTKTKSAPSTGALINSPPTASPPLKKKLLSPWDDYKQHIRGEITNDSGNSTTHSNGNSKNINESSEDTINTDDEDDAFHRWLTSTEIRNNNNNFTQNEAVVGREDGDGHHGAAGAAGGDSGLYATNNDYNVADRNYENIDMETDNRFAVIETKTKSTIRPPMVTVINAFDMAVEGGDGTIYYENIQKQKYEQNFSVNNGYNNTNVNSNNNMTNRTGLISSKYKSNNNNAYQNYNKTNNHTDKPTTTSNSHSNSSSSSSTSRSSSSGSNEDTGAGNVVNIDIMLTASSLDLQGQQPQQTHVETTNPHRQLQLYDFEHEKQISKTQLKFMEPPPVLFSNINDVDNNNNTLYTITTNNTRNFSINSNNNKKHKNITDIVGEGLNGEEEIQELQNVGANLSSTNNNFNNNRANSHNLYSSNSDSFNFNYIPAPALVSPANATSPAAVTSVATTTTTTATTPPALSTTMNPERQCNVMGTLYKIGDILPQDTGNCLQCICIDGSTSDDTPRVTCSPHNCPPLVLPDLFDATGY